MEGKDLQWHPGFYAAFDTETKGTGFSLQNEYPLGTKPTMIDILARKAEGGGSLIKNIVRLFRRHNIIEYKNPESYVSVNDYYKVLSYTARYIADTGGSEGVDPEEVTMTFVCNRYPKKMVGHLQKAYGGNVEEVESGIYYLSGAPFPLQIIIIHELDPRKNLWLYSMRRNLTDEEIAAVLDDYRKHRNEKNYQSAMDLIARANWEKIKEKKEMCNALEELFMEVYGEKLEKEVKEEVEKEVEKEKSKYEEAIEKLEEERKQVREERKQVREERKQAEEKVKNERENTLISMIKKKLQKNKTAEVIAEELEEDVASIYALIAKISMTTN